MICTGQHVASTKRRNKHPILISLRVCGISCVSRLAANPELQKGHASIIQLLLCLLLADGAQ
jgi:hypothetical protein